MDGAGKGNAVPGVESLSVKEISDWAPSLGQVLRQMGVPIEGYEESSFALLCEEAGIDVSDVYAAIATEAPIRAKQLDVQSITITGGTDKDGRPEPLQTLEVRAGEAIALVGATGSGKTQLLIDLEGLARGDTPSHRTVLVNGAPPTDEMRWSPASKLVAQVSQSMSFLLNVSVGEFIELHASARATGNDDPERTIREVIDAACTLCGEPFSATTALAVLSGGQSRALMVADAALVSCSPVILVDEIENAGIDREKALDLLVGQGKIAFLASHDPLLALRATKRVVLRNGAMQAVLTLAGEERDRLAWLEDREREVVRLRGMLRSGGRLVP